MPNRFARRIRAGKIRTLEELKSEFKSLAKETHPDLAGFGATETFVQAREEYESALRNFERHRFGARGRRNSGDLAPGGAGRNFDAVPAAFAALAILRNRGFPKSPRHEKERLRYEYALYRCALALERLGEGRGEGLETVGRLLLELRSLEPRAVQAVLRHLDALAEYSAKRLPAMRTALILASKALGSDSRIPGEVSRFLAELHRDLGLGPVLPGE